jgi:hypothetical protein
MTLSREAIQPFGGIAPAPAQLRLAASESVLALAHGLSGLASPRQLPAEPPNLEVPGEIRRTRPARSACASPPRVPPDHSQDHPRARERERWSNDKNRRRATLIDKEIAGTLSEDEALELEDLQAQMLAFRRHVAPLPLDDLRALHQELLERAGKDKRAEMT